MKRVMTETWLNSNRRFLLLSFVPVTGFLLLGLAVLTLATAAPLRGCGWALLLLGAALGVGLTREMRRPRIAFDGECVLFHVRGVRPVAVPVEGVEAFFLGQGPARLPSGLGPRPMTVNLVARLSQKRAELKSGQVKAALACWEDHYLTVRGMWCEILDLDKVRQLNKRLHQAHQSQRDKQRGAAMEAGRS